MEDRSYEVIPTAMIHDIMVNTFKICTTKKTKRLK